MKVLVTGGGGFLGRAIVDRLLARGDQVRSYSRGTYPRLESDGVECHRGDLSDPDAVTRAVEGCDLVFHTAAKAGIWGSFEAYFDANVAGTQNVIQACRRHGVERLVYTSSPSVTFAGRDQEKVDESEPYPERFLAHYPATKAEGEQRVLQANAPDLRTVALRPHLIWGPGDPHLVPRIIERAKEGKLRHVGRRSRWVDSTYIDNAADAHLLAANRLSSTREDSSEEAGSPVAGKAYFISQGEPLPLRDLIDRILAAAHLPPVTRTIPTGLAYAAGAALEGIYKLLGREEEPPMSRFLARQLSTAHWFDLTAARRDLDYRPTVTLNEGMRRLEQWLDHRLDRPLAVESPVHELG